MAASGRILPRFDFRIDIASRSEKGPVRELNEDAFLVAPELALFGIADGMGGLEGGEVASSLALAAARSLIAERDSQALMEAYVAVPQLENRRKVLALLRRACENAHAAVLAEHGEDEDPRKQMGTTLDLCLLVRDRAFFAHVGDARVFLARPSATLLVTQDHVRHADLAYSPTTLRAPRPLSSAIGVRAPLRVDTFFVDLHKNDRIVLATDGAYSAVNDEMAMTRLCQKAPNQIADELCQLALEKGGRDNATVVVLRIGDRFLARSQAVSQRQNDFAVIQQNPLVVDLDPSMVLAALAAGIEIDLAEGAEITQLDAGDLCAYLVLDGVVEITEKNGTPRTSLGAPALLFGESLVGVTRDASAIKVKSHARLIRVRADDFREVCSHDSFLGTALYERLARHLARTLR